MELRILNLYLSRILSGFYTFIYKDTKYKLVYPDISVKYEADLFAEEEYENNKFNDWISDNQIIYTLIDLGMWSIDGDKKLKNLETQIEDIKIDLYKNFLNPNKTKSLRKTLENHKKNYNKLFETRHSLDHITPSGYSNLLKSQYILINSIYDIYNSKVFNSLENIDHAYLDNIANIVAQNNIDISVFRLLARSDVWKNYWSANKDYLFDKPTINWTDEQRTLVVLTKMYDSAYEHPDCPPDSVFDDDDAFDGWMILQKRENEKNKNKNRTDKMLDKKLNKAQEVYLMAHSKEEAQNIYNLNDQQSLGILKERNQAIMNSGKELVEAQLPDVQRNLVVESNKRFMESRRK